eukprot:CAMPEP_0204829656 /NCGR_PEP_ID=MMETSP1346-20131115/7949_1 /ASSEMBLY_ACC=CAM_ASM_000771 /TAXON_ID=215587 /ORGANISM="Aplanochytrium stocchinoi, Strain GSBS06" /LENGTH=353 /DNA_ID=CAMNT_0051959637 /DNA_START=185 /DNA_END=1242 /DNA_ORIENTATION=-
MPRKSSRKRQSKTSKDGDGAEQVETTDLIPVSASKSKRVRALRSVEAEDSENENVDRNNRNSNSDTGMVFASQSAYLGDHEINNVADDDDEADPVPNADVEFHPDTVIKTFTQATHVDTDEADSGVDEHVGSVMRFILFTCSTGKTCTLDRIKQIALNNEVTSKKSLMNLMGKAQVGLKDLFGYDLVCEAYVKEAPKAKFEPIIEKGDKKKRKKQNEEVVILTKDRWILINRSESDDDKVKRAQESSDNDKRAQLMVILALISLHDCKISETKLLVRLADDLGIKDGSELLREFLAENYLKRRRRQGEVDVDGKVIWDLTFGAKTYLTIGLGNIVKFLEQTCGQSLDKRDKAR